MPRGCSPVALSCTKPCSTPHAMRIVLCPSRAADRLCGLGGRHVDAAWRNKVAADGPPLSDPFSRAGCAFPRRPLGRHRRLAAARRTQRRTAPVRPDPIPYRSGDTALDLLQRCGRRYAHAVRFQYWSPGPSISFPARALFQILRTTAPARFSSSRTPSDSSARGFKAGKRRQ